MSVLSFPLLFGCVGLASCTYPGDVVQTEDKNITEIVYTGPDHFYAGEFDTSNIMIVVTYSDGSKKTVTVTTSMVPESEHYCLNRPGTYQITILFRGKSFGFSKRRFKGESSDKSTKIEQCAFCGIQASASGTAIIFDYIGLE